MSKLLRDYLNFAKGFGLKVYIAIKIKMNFSKKRGKKTEKNRKR